jgi:tetratricopeptide (TPR) repeat protein
VLRLSPTDPKTLYYLGEVYRRRGEKRDTAKALDAYRRALSSDPSYADPHKGLGLLYYQTGQRQKAKAEFQKYLQRDPTAKDAGVIKDYLSELK